MVIIYINVLKGWKWIKSIFKAIFNFDLYVEWCLKHSVPDYLAVSILLLFLSLVQIPLVPFLRHLLGLE